MSWADRFALSDEEDENVDTDLLDNMAAGNIRNAHHQGYHLLQLSLLRNGPHLRGIRSNNRRLLFKASSVLNRKR